MPVVCFRLTLYSRPLRRVLMEVHKDTLDVWSFGESKDSMKFDVTATQLVVVKHDVSDWLFRLRLLMLLGVGSLVVGCA